MHFDSINEALIACVKAAGGSKTVGGSLWPEELTDAIRDRVQAVLYRRSAESPRTEAKAV